MIEYLDAFVGRILDEVEPQGIAKETLIVFMGDQGGSRTNSYGRTLTKRSLKVACNAAWPSRIDPGTRSGMPWVHYDLYAAFAGLAGAEVPRDRVIDAHDVWPLFMGKDERDRPMHWTWGAEDACHEGEFKLHLTDEKPDGLFDPALDPDEKQSILDTHSDRVARMRQLHLAWKAECRAQQTSKPS